MPDQPAYGVELFCDWGNYGELRRELRTTRYLPHGCCLTTIGYAWLQGDFSVRGLVEELVTVVV